MNVLGISKDAAATVCGPPCFCGVSGLQGPLPPTTGLTELIKSVLTGRLTSRDTPYISPPSSHSLPTSSGRYRSILDSRVNTPTRMRLFCCR